MTIENMRMYIMKVYDNLTWKHKVERMSGDQVIAIYHSFLERDKFKTKKPIPHQMTLEDFGINLR